MYPVPDDLPGLDFKAGLLLDPVTGDDGSAGDHDSRGQHRRGRPDRRPANHDRSRAARR
jgi:hypothetical protein